MGAVGKARRGVGPSGGGEQRRTGSELAARRSRTYAVLAAPSLVLLVLVNVYPVLYAGAQVTRNGSLVSAGDFVGLDNFERVFNSPTFLQSVGFTIVFAVVGVFGSWVIGLGLALVIRQPIPGASAFKVLLLLPWVVPVVVSSTSWNWLVATPQSPVPIVASAIGLGDITILSDPTLAAVLVCLFKVWVSFPFMMMMMSAALSSVDSTVYEAARVDGAAGWTQFTEITLPLTARTTYISWILMTIFCVNDFPTIYLLTGGGPVNSTSTLVVLAYKTVFYDFQTGPGVAIAFLMTFVLIGISVLLYRRLRNVDVA